MSRIKSVLSSNAVIGLYLTCVLLVFLSYLEAYPVPELGQKLLALLISIYVLLGSYSLAHVVLKLISFSIKRRLFTDGLRTWIFVYKTTLGVGTLGFLVLILGWALPFSLKLKLTGLNLVLGLSCLVAFVDFLKSEPFPNKYSEGFSKFAAILLALGVPGLLITLLSAFAPVTYYDSLVYHLGLPAIYNHQGSISAIPYNLYSFFPAGIEMVFLFVINQFGTPDYVVNLVGFWISVLTSVAIFLWAKEVGGQIAGYLSFFLWWTMPAVIFLSVGAYIDLPLAFFTFIAARLFWESYVKNWDPFLLILSGLVSGFAAATKYTGFTCPVLLVIALFIILWTTPKKHFIKLFLVFGISAAIPSIPWLIKNYFAIGNPVFPFLASVFANKFAWTKAASDGYFHALTEYGTKSHVLYDLFVAPFSIAQSALQFGGGFDVLGDFGWGIVLFFIPFGFFMLEKKVVRFSLGFSICTFLIWALTKPVLRFLFPMLPFGIFLVSLGFARILERRKVVQLATMVIVTCWIVSGFFIFFQIADVLKPFQVPLGLMSREHFLSTRLSFYPTIKFANENCVTTDKIMLVGEQRGYHLNIPFVATNFFAPSLLAYVSSSSDDPESIIDDIRRQGFTHLLLNESEVNRLGGAKSLGISNERYEHLISTLKHDHILFSQNDVYLFSL